MAQHESVAHIRLDLDDQTVQSIRAAVRDEITEVLKVLGRAAGYEGRMTESEIGERAATVLEAAVEGAVRRLTCEHEFRSYQTDRCWSCDEPQPEPVNPFEEQGNG